VADASRLRSLPTPRCRAGQRKRGREPRWTTDASGKKACSASSAAVPSA